MQARAPRETPVCPAVELRHVHKQFGRVQAVRNVSLQIRENEFFSLLGPSGCGKTTILRMIGGFERPSAGDVCLAGRVANQIPPYRRDTNLIFQHLALFPHLDVFDNVAFGLRLRRLDRQAIRQKASRALDLVDLAGFESRRIHQLSGGQQQRVAIARALVNEPKVLLLDEPLGSLDLRLRMQMQVELKELQHRVGTTFVYVTHDQTEALTMSDRIAVMREGVVDQVGTGRDVYERPRTKFVATFLGDSNLLEGRVAAQTAEAVTVETPSRMIVAPPNSSAAPGSAVHVCVRPERVRVFSRPEPSPDIGPYENLVEASVQRGTFKGAFVEYRALTASGQSLIIHAQPGTDGRLEPGDSVRVAWRKDDCTVLTE